MARDRRTTVRCRLLSLELCIGLKIHKLTGKHFDRKVKCFSYRPSFREVGRVAELRLFLEKISFPDAVEGFLKTSTGNPIAYVTLRPNVANMNEICVAISVSFSCENCDRAKLCGVNRWES